MARRSLLWRLYAGYAALVLLLAVLTSALVAPGLRRASQRDIEASLRAQTTLLAELSQPYFLAASTDAPVELGKLVAQVDAASARTSTRFTLVRPDGTVVVDSHEPPAQLENHAERPELRDARLLGEGVSVRYSRTLRTNMMYVAEPVLSEGEVIGLARSSVSLASIDQRIAELRIRVALSAVVVLVVALLSGWWLARRITRPLRQLTVAAEAMRGGDYKHRIRVDSEDEVATLAGTFNELGSELDRRLEELQRDRSRTLTILAGMTEGVLAVDRDENVVLINEAAGRMLGIDPDQSAGRPLWEVIRLQSIVALVTDTVRAQGDEDRPRESRATRDGRHFELSAARLRDAQGDISGAVAVLHDVTELRHLELVRKDFVSNVSHELKTPLTAIAGFVESMIDDPEMDPKTRHDFLERAKKQTQRLHNLVQDLLSLSRAEQAKTALETRALDLRPSLDRAADALLAICERKGVRLDMDLSSDPLLVRADEESLRQIFDNLLSNAVRYTESGGRVTARASGNGDTVAVEIVDTGIGIESRHHARIFERFYRVDTARSRELGGTGLGLSIVKHVVQSLGGTISLQSSLGTGSTFRVELPAAS